MLNNESIGVLMVAMGEKKTDSYPVLTHISKL